MSVDKYSCLHFSLSRKVDEAEPALAITALLRSLAGYLEEIDGLTDDGIKDIVIRPEIDIDGDTDLIATVYYSLD
ncbi:hypothetical protein OG474_25370 [Kribbella sp. NBC_01505]|uniref:hypothetical protein n=1 Tax=Kribbella sp. NBC_01505 TaxID=2903580 RepID=UPI00386D7514